jgi:CRISPR-associated endonuclease Csn1
VTHKQDHGKQGRLHNDTAYGLASDPDDKGVREVVHRKMLLDLKSRKDIDTVRDLTLRGRINEAVLEGEADGLTLRESLARFSRQTGVRRVRVLERLRVIPIENKAGYAYKGYKGDSNHCYDIFDTAKGRWIGQVVTAFEANANENPSAPPLATRGVMRLRKDDLIAIGDEDDRRVMRVVKFSPGQIVLADHHEGGNLKQRDAMDDEEDPFRYLTRTPNSLRDLFARKVHVDILGRVRDPGPPA